VQELEDPVSAQQCNMETKEKNKHLMSACHQVAPKGIVATNNCKTGQIGSQTLCKSNIVARHALLSEPVPAASGHTILVTSMILLT